MRIVSHVVTCQMTVVVIRLTPYGVDRLQRCRAAKCRLMLPVDGFVQCVGMSGGKCQWISEWTACLNGNKPFPNGTEDCSHWANNQGERNEKKTGEQA